MPKGSLYIHLMKIPSLRSSKGYNRSKGGVSGHRCKYVIIIYAFLLREATGNESCLELFNTSIRSMLDLVEPFRGDNCFVLWSWDHIILHNGLILLCIASFQTWCFTTSSKDPKSVCTVVLMAARYPWYLYGFLDFFQNFPLWSHMSLSHEDLLSFSKGIHSGVYIDIFSLLMSASLSREDL